MIICLPLIKWNQTELFAIILGNVVHFKEHTSSFEDLEIHHCLTVQGYDKRMNLSAKDKS